MFHILVIEIFTDSCHQEGIVSLDKLPPLTILLFSVPVDERDIMSFIHWGRLRRALQTFGWISALMLCSGGTVFQCGDENNRKPDCKMFKLCMQSSLNSSVSGRHDMTCACGQQICF